jgi:CubicO group peptidase (beta-lactamase class C family)
MAHTVVGQGVSKELETEIKRRVALEINPSIAIGILLPNGSTAYYNYGYFNTKNKLPDSLTLYEIGSVTKTFTATLTTIHLKGALHQPLSNFIPQANLNQLILADLRNHLAGVPRLSEQFSPPDWSDPFNGYSNELLMEELQGLEADTSGVWGYSNWGYSILGRVIEVATKQSFDTLMSDLLDKIGMENTWMEHPKNTQEQLAQPTNIGTINSYWKFTGPSRYAGGLISNTKDLLKYLEFQQQTNPLFKTTSINGAIPTGINQLGKDQLFYKDGWFVWKPDTSTHILLHNGGTGGFTSFVGYNTQTKMGVVVLSNSVSIVDDIGLHLIYPASQLKQPQRTIAFELADAIDAGKGRNLVAKYQRLQKAAYPDNIIDIYWLERFHFGQSNYGISRQLSEIMVQALPEDWEVHDIQGQNLEQLKKYKKAAKAYQKALALNPNHPLLEEKIKRCTQINKQE